MFLDSNGHIVFGVSLPVPQALASRMEPSKRDARKELSRSTRGYPGICLQPHLDAVIFRCCAPVRMRMTAASLRFHTAVLQRAIAPTYL